jgi:hypothetical protein
MANLKRTKTFESLLQQQIRINDILVNLLVNVPYPSSDYTRLLNRQQRLVSIALKVRQQMSIALGIEILYDEKNNAFYYNPQSLKSNLNAPIEVTKYNQLDTIF